jgi:hypothetical protein
MASMLMINWSTQHFHFQYFLRQSLKIEMLEAERLTRLYQK